MPDSQLPAWLDATFEEYRAQRTSALEIEKAAQHTITFGGATIGVLIAGGVNAWDHRLPATLIFLVVVPLIACAVGIQWSGQMLSLGRKGQYLELIEAAIRKAHLDLPEEHGVPAAVPAAFFTWEQKQHERYSRRWWQPDSRWQSSAGMVVFGIIGASSLVVGAYRGWHGHESLMIATVAVEEAVFWLILIVLLWTLGGFYARGTTEAYAGMVVNESLPPKS